MVENMRKALKLIERRVTFALQHQAVNEAECEEDLLEVLKGVHATAELAIKGIEVS